MLEIRKIPLGRELFIAGIAILQTTPHLTTEKVDIQKSNIRVQNENV